MSLISLTFVRKLINRWGNRPERTQQRSQSTDKEAADQVLRVPGSRVLPSLLGARVELPPHAVERGVSKAGGVTLPIMAPALVPVSLPGGRGPHAHPTVPVVRPSDWGT